MSRKRGVGVVAAPTGAGRAAPGTIPLALRRNRSEILAGLLLLAMTFAAYWFATDNGFVNYDDDHYVTNNDEVKRGLSGDGLRWALTTTDATNWHPLTWISLQLDAQLHGSNPRGYHRTNVLLHAANTLLLFAALRRLTRATWRSAFAAALFAVHPLHVESVAWVAERKDVLSTLFWMITLLGYAHYAEKPGVRRYLSVVVPFALGLMAKPMLVTLPFVLLLLDYWPLRRLAVSASGILIGEKIPLFALTAASCVATWYAQHHGGAVASFQILPLSGRVGNALVSYCAYLGKLFWPVDLAVLYPHPGLDLPLWKVLGAGVLLSLITLVVVALCRRLPYLAVGWLWYLGTLVPVIGLVQVGQQGMADRYTYVPFIGLFIAAAWGLGDLAEAWQYQKVLIPWAGLVLFGCILQSMLQVFVWSDSVSLWKHCLGATGPNPEAHDHLGTAHGELAMAYRKAGRVPEANDQFNKAIDQFNKAIELDRDFGRAHNNLGVVYGKNDQPEKAKKEFAEALRINERDPDALLNMAVALKLEGDLDGALEHLNKAYEMNPRDPRVQRELEDVRLRKAPRPSKPLSP